MHSRRSDSRDTVAPDTEADASIRARSDTKQALADICREREEEYRLDDGDRERDEEEQHERREEEEDRYQRAEHRSRCRSRSLKGGEKEGAGKVQWRVRVWARLMAKVQKNALHPCLMLDDV